MYELLVEACSTFTVMFNNSPWGNGDTIKVTCSTRTLQSICKPPKIRGPFLLNYWTLLQKQERISDLKSSQSVSRILKVIPIAQFNDGEANPKGNHDPKHMFHPNNLSEFSAQLSIKYQHAQKALVNLWQS